jgi:DNA invertase Pin-like site-specific DNA recombinase
LTEVPAGKGKPSRTRKVAVNELGRWIGSSHPKAKLTDAQVDDIRSRREDQGQSTAYIARALGVPRRTVRDILNYSRRAQTPVDWKKIDDDRGA